MSSGGTDPAVFIGPVIGVIFWVTVIWCCVRRIRRRAVVSAQVHQQAVAVEAPATAKVDAQINQAPVININLAALPPGTTIASATTGDPNTAGPPLPDKGPNVNMQDQRNSQIGYMNNEKVGYSGNPPPAPPYSGPPQQNYPQYPPPNNAYAPPQGNNYNPPPLAAPQAVYNPMVTQLSYNPPPGQPGSPGPPPGQQGAPNPHNSFYGFPAGHNNV